MPRVYYDESGQEHVIRPDENDLKRVTLSNTCIITVPWHTGRMKDNVLHILKEGFIFHPNNHRAYYYDGLDICHVWNGFHSITSGIYSKEGYIDAERIDIKPLFEHVKTDGVNFYNLHTGDFLYEVQDFRIAIIFEIEKMKYKLELEP